MVAPKSFLVVPLGVASLVMSLAATAALALAITLAPARSGPNCLTDDCISYPYTDIAAYVPNDYWWMYPATLLPLVLVATLVFLRPAIPSTRQSAAWLAILAAQAAAVVLGLAYVIQLMVIQPSAMKGESEALVLWSQYNPHGLFIALENLGYLFVCIALLAVGWLFPGPGSLSRITRWWSGVFGAIGLLGLPVLVLLLRYDLEYHYEVLSLLAAWIGLLGLGPLLALRARGADGRTTPDPRHHRASQLAPTD